MRSPEVISLDIWHSSLSPAERLPLVAAEVRRLLSFHNIAHKEHDYQAPGVKTFVEPLSSPQSLAKLSQRFGKISSKEINRRYVNLARGLIEISTDRATSLLLKGRMAEYFYEYSDLFPYALTFIHEMAKVSSYSEKINNELVHNLFRPIDDNTFSLSLSNTLYSFVNAHVPRPEQSLLFDSSSTLMEQAMLVYMYQIKPNLTELFNKWWEAIVYGRARAGYFHQGTGEVKNYGDDPNAMKREYLIRLATKIGIITPGIIASLLDPSKISTIALASTLIASGAKDWGTYRNRQKFTAKFFPAIDVHETIHRESADVNSRRRMGRVGYLSFRY